MKRHCDNHPQWIETPSEDGKLIYLFCPWCKYKTVTTTKAWNNRGELYKKTGQKDATYGG